MARAKKTESDAKETVEKIGLHNLVAAPGSHRDRKRIGRGPGSGTSAPRTMRTGKLQQTGWDFNDVHKDARSRAAAGPRILVFGEVCSFFTRLAAPLPLSF